MTDTQQYAAPNSWVGSQTDLLFYDRDELKPDNYSPTTSEVHWTEAQEALSTSFMVFTSPPLMLGEDGPPFCLRVIAAPPWSPPANTLLRRATTTSPIPMEMIMEVATSLEYYESLWQNDAGNAEVHLLPHRVFMQTPNDSWPFCSLIVKTNRTYRNSLHPELPAIDLALLISSDIPVPLRLPAPVSSQLAPAALFEHTDIPLIFLPLGFLIHHVRLFSTKLADLTETVSFIEKEVIDANDETDTQDLIKKLHICNRNVAELQRRWHFQQNLAPPRPII